MAARNVPSLHPLFAEILRPIAPKNDPPYDGKLIDNLIDQVERVEKPKPPQPAPITQRDPRERNAAMLLSLWEQGEQMAAQAFELRVKPDPLAIALNGFPDVNTSYADAAGR